MVHRVVSKYVQFVIGIYKLADLCEAGTDMIMHRLSALKGHVSELLQRMAVEHYGDNSNKMPLLFKVNNLHFIFKALSQLGLAKAGQKDIAQFEKELDKAVQALIEVILAEHFVGVHQLINTYSKPSLDDS